MAGVAGNSSWWNPIPHFTAALQRHRRTTFFLGFVSGLILSLGSVSSVLLLYERREKRRRRRRLRQYGIDEQGLERERAKSSIELRSGEIVRGIEGLIGNTPLMRINSLSDLTGCEILGKAEFLNPAGSPKDRVALQILNDAEEEGLLHPHTGSCIFEGTVGSTGISLATLARAKGYRCSIVIPDDVAREKVELLRKLGAEVEQVRPRGIVDARQFVNVARTRAEEFGRTELVGPHAPVHFGGGGGDDGDDVSTDPSSAHVKHETRRSDLVVTTLAERRDVDGDGAEEDPDELETRPRGFFADQFENSSNFDAHYFHTGPEIWRQTGGALDAFVAGAGTGGTLSGVAAYLKRMSASERIGHGARDVHVVLADPHGSGLYNRVRYGVMYAPTEAEGKRRRHQVDSVVEGIGINRLTNNFELGAKCVDDAERVTDEEAIRMSRWLVLNDGLFLGSSSAVNCVAAVRTALKLKKLRSSTSSGEPPIMVVTVLCDSGARHLSKFHDDEALRKLGLDVGSDISDILKGE